MGLLALRPSDLLTILKMALSIGYRRSVPFLSAIQATGLLTFTPVGLSPTKHASLSWTRDFFTVPTITFRVLYCFFVIEHDRRRILHFNATAHPTSDWIVQQLREALPLPFRYRYPLFDRDAKFGTDVLEFLEASGIRPMRTSIRSPWQNGVAERWVGSCRREMLDHVIPLSEQHLRRLGRDYLAYYHEDRTHIGLDKQTPAKRPLESRPSQHREPFALPRIGGLHHRYTWSVAA